MRRWQIGYAAACKAAQPGSTPGRLSTSSKGGATMTPDDITLVMTCSACPEQYDAFVGDQRVGYLRLRWSTFEVTCPDVGGETVYETEIGDSGFDGCFENDEQC